MSFEIQQTPNTCQLENKGFNVEEGVCLISFLHHFQSNICLFLLVLVKMGILTLMLIAESVEADADTEHYTSDL